ncbi:Uncharacterized conserved protein YlxW, UPF0749 family [Micromonospora pattaloongensis]|uniref:Uncharacterized conserved protein YlxW, UPF0749 family n=1 Tax=Micromonospora pattaloongensis TaxID=405436 RepID=A0A1H3I0B6_9ACTN|nr:DUF881 domain-containing protein [Micromonospora pattaloongensis]SDY21141.1 Uncharacterized conserved protein YlxW, UPF0749 family [Micromonospora pattaloongensis]
MEYTSGASSWGKAFRRAIVGLLPRRTRRRSVWSIGVPLISLAAGLLFTTTATTAGGTSLREDRRPEITQVINERRERVAASEERARRLRDQTEQQADAIAGKDGPINEQRARVARSLAGAGFTALRGRGLTVELNDAPRLNDSSRPGNPSNDDLVVHQGDVQAVVNAMWAGGAEAMSIMGVRVLSTSAVRCVGNTLLLDGRVYSPPFRITAIGDPAALRRALDSDQGVREFKDAVLHYRLGYRETVESNVTVPAYAGSSGLRSAGVPGE